MRTTFASAGLLLARLVKLAMAIVAAIVVLAIVFVALDANTGNTIVWHVERWASTLVGPFDDIFSLSTYKGTIALNYGLALVIYLLATGFIVRLLVTPAEVDAGRPRAAAEPPAATP